MVPTLYHGDLLLVHWGTWVRPGDVVVLRHPFQQDLLVVKRAAQRREGGWWVLGDNAYAGGDSTDYWVVPEDLVLVRHRLRYRPLGPGRRSPFALVRWALSAVRPGAARPVGRQALAGPVGGHVGAGGAAVGAGGAAVGGGVQVGVAARGRLAHAQAVHAVLGEVEGQAHRGDRGVPGGRVRRVVGQVHVPAGGRRRPGSRGRRSGADRATPYREFSRSTARVSSPPSAASKTARSRARTPRNRVTSASVARRAADWLSRRSRTASTDVSESLPRTGSSVLTRRTA
ncbi:hypothetical protein SFUMM280S_00009 [Streptomyces fumanus]